jgi:hypothetical protein
LRLAAGVIALVLAIQIIGTSWDALRFAAVGPRAHLTGLRELRSMVEGRSTLFLGNDDYLRWELAGAQVNAPFIGYLGISPRPEKKWEYGQPFDFDSLDVNVLNEYDWFITPRDAAGSDPPDGVRLERSTRSFQLWRRVEEIEPRELLAEGSGAAARLDCSKPRGRRLARAGGVAAVRAPTVGVPVGAVGAGETREVELPLDEGEWDLQAQYLSQHDVDITADGFQATLPAQLDRPGVRWPIGRIRVSGPGPVALRLRVDEGPLTPPGVATSMDGILATPVSPTRMVPMRQACGKLVDWYRAH